MVDLDAVIARSAQRACRQRVQTVLIEPGLYRCHSKSGQGWYRITATRFGPDVIVSCSCAGGTYFRDDLGSSACKHAVSVAKRLLRRAAELLALPQAADAEYTAWLAGLRDYVTIEESVLTPSRWQLTDTRREFAAEPGAPAPFPAAAAGNEVDLAQSTRQREAV